MPRPRIGLTTYVEMIHHGGWDERSAFAPSTYVDAIGRAGGTPVLLPPSPAAPHDVLGALDGLVIIGGPDVDPGRYGAVPHRYTDPASRLGRILGAEHDGLCHPHQALDRLGGGLRVAARAADSTVEAVEMTDKRFAVGVQ